VKKGCYSRSLQKKEAKMAKQDEVKKVAEKAGKPGKAPKNKAAKTKVQEKKREKGATQKKPARARAETVFRLKSPQAAQVFVVGCFNGWDPTANPLTLDDEGTWSCSLAIEAGEHEYRFVVDGVWCDDPANMSRRLNEFGTQNCVLIVQD
jgi:1,4-alpha-glucan branching enzyme